MAKFPHMLPADTQLWIRFLATHADHYHNFVYDIHVGEGIPLDPAWPPNIQAAAGALTQKRIDVVATAKDEVWIFEIKPDAGLSALGQLLGYRELYIKKFGRPKKLLLAVITDNINPDEKFLFKHFDIKIFTV